MDVICVLPFIINNNLRKCFAGAARLHTKAKQKQTQAEAQKQAKTELSELLTNMSKKQVCLYRSDYIDYTFFIDNQMFKQSPRKFGGANKKRKLNNTLRKQAKTLFLHRKPKRNAHFLTCQFKSVHYIL